MSPTSALGGAVGPATLLVADDPDLVTMRTLSYGKSASRMISLVMYGP
jgi:hypothetical protein